MTEASLARAFEIQAGACAAFGSPFSAALLAEAALDIQAGGPLRGLVDPWAGTPDRTLLLDAVALRWLAAAHDLALSGDHPGLTGAYPDGSQAGDSDLAWREARAAMIHDSERFAAFMNHEPQTNEVRRSACLLPGYLVVAQETGLPLRMFELGASAGLNQLWDRFRYDYVGSDGAAGWRWGNPASTLRLDAEWRGGPPPFLERTNRPAVVASRAACDRKPVQLSDRLARRRLTAYVWADQADRLARLRAAVAMALAGGVNVEAIDALAWTKARAAPVDGAATVLCHSVFWQYLAVDTQSALEALIAELGAKATASAPFAWVRMEPTPSLLHRQELRLTLWPGGEERLLARGHPHGAWVEWL